MNETKAELMRNALEEAGAEDIFEEARKYRRILSNAYRILENNLDLTDKDNVELFVKMATALYPEMTRVFRAEKALREQLLPTLSKD